METRLFNGVWERCCPTSRASWLPGCWGSALRAPRADVGAMSSCSWPPRGVQALLAHTVSPSPFSPACFRVVSEVSWHLHGTEFSCTAWTKRAQNPKKPRKARGKRGVSGRDGEDGNKSCRNPTAPARSAQSFADVPRLGASRGLLFQPRPLWVCSATGVGAVGAVSPPQALAEGWRRSVPAPAVLVPTGTQVLPPQRPLFGVMEPQLGAAPRGDGVSQTARQGVGGFSKPRDFLGADWGGEKTHGARLHHAVSCSPCLVPKNANYCGEF